MKYLVCLFLICHGLSVTSCSAQRRAGPRKTNATTQQDSGRQRLTQTIRGRVVSVTDGDTIRVLDDKDLSQVIRLKSIDAPERAQDFSDVSRRHLGELIAGKQVDVQYDKIERGRVIGKVLINGQDICLEQIKAGLAWHYKYYENEQTQGEREEYALAEQTARSAKRGLWQYELPTAPWDFRRNGRTNNSSVETGSHPSPISVLSNGHIIGNRRSMIYHWPGCPHYNDIAPGNRVYLDSREDAERAGFRAARNCN
jgi:endonuclease YncB( thermonuclease family)